MKPDPLKDWRSRHTRESKTITVLETDWPGTLEVCRNAVDYIARNVTDLDNRDTAIQASLTAALDAYRSSVERVNISDRGRLLVFVETLIAGLISQFPAKYANSAKDSEHEWVQRLVPANLREALSDLPLSDTCQEWTRDAA
ncbi:MAG: hypothetical protein ACOYMG_26020 [Candidatus Methylumidiphilus sp.]